MGRANIIPPIPNQGIGEDTEYVKHLRGKGKKVGVVSIKLLQPFPEGELVAALDGKKAVTVMERSEINALTSPDSGKFCNNPTMIKHAISRLMFIGPDMEHLKASVN